MGMSSSSRVIRKGPRTGVILEASWNWCGDKRWYEIRHQGTLFGRFTDDHDAALDRFRVINRAAILMLDIQEGVA